MIKASIKEVTEVNVEEKSEDSSPASIQSSTAPGARTNANGNGSGNSNGKGNGKRAGGASLSVLRPILILLILLSIAASWIYLSRKPSAPEGVIELSGRIEGYETDIGAKIGGRVDLISRREGETVKKGELLAKLSDDDIQAQLQGSRARIEKARAQVESARDRLAVLNSQISEADLRVNRSSEESQGRIRQWESNVAMSEARLSQAKAELTRAEADLKLAETRKQRYEFLVSKGAVSRDEYDQVVSTCDAAVALVAAGKASVVAAEKDLKSAHGQLTQARSSRLSPAIEGAAKLSLQKQLLQAKNELKSAEHEVANAQADSEAIQANIAYLQLNSPIEGVVTARPVEPGAVVVPGQTILSVIDLSKVYLRAYVPEGDIGKIRIGQEAKVFLDASPEKPFQGKVSQIDPQASFTPENIYFKDDRVKQVFGIKISIDKPGGFAKPGMPADAQVKLD